MKFLPMILLSFSLMAAAPSQARSLGGFVHLMHSIREGSPTETSSTNSPSEAATAFTPEVEEITNNIIASAFAQGKQVQSSTITGRSKRLAHRLKQPNPKQPERVFGNK